MKKCIHLLFFLPVFLTAQQVIWDEKNDFIGLGNKVSVLKDPGGELTINQVRSGSYSKKFVPSDKTILNFGFTEAIHWLKFSFNNPGLDELVLEVSHAFLPITELYYADQTGKMVKMEAGYNLPVNDRIIKTHFQGFPLPKGSHEFYLRILSNSHPLPIGIYKKEAAEVKSYRQKLAYGFYLGFMFFVMLSNIFFYFSLRNKLYLFYAFIVVVYVSYAAAVMDGFILYIFPKADLMFWYITIPTIGVAVQMIYCISFLETKKYTPNLNKAAWIVTLYFISYAILKFFMPLTTVLAINTANALLSFFMMGFIGYKVGKKGNKLGYYFAFAYFIYFILVLTEATYIQTGSPAYFADISHVAMATLIEAFILSYLLSRRFEWEKQSVEKARMNAQQKLVESTLENEKIIREQNIILEKTVSSRTEELQNTLQTVESEREKSELLLLNILPAEIARELKENGIAKPKTHESVSVLFADFKDFTRSTENVNPELLISDLNVCFSAFDKLMQKHKLEKIKTIGDAYMAAGGLPVSNDTHPSDIINAALDMQTFIAEWKKKQAEAGRIALDLRIGIHTGPVVSGVVGMHKFSYDIWGDTVNTASRMESLGIPGKINISKTTYMLTKDKFEFTPRGKIEVKGKGEIDMYLVNGLVKEAVVSNALS